MKQIFFNEIIDDVENGKKGVLTKIVLNNMQAMGIDGHKKYKQKVKFKHQYKLNSQDPYKAVGGANLLSSIKIRQDDPHYDEKVRSLKDLTKKDMCLDFFRDAFIKSPHEAQDIERLKRLTKFKFIRTQKQTMFNSI
jgi:hypothetical protein